MRAMILSAGLGTRLKPITDSIPKALLKINNQTLLELQIKKLKSEGIDRTIINVHHFADKVIEYLKKNYYFDCSIEISDESEELLDTGGGLKKASHFFSDGKPFLVYNVDILSNIDLKKLINFHQTSSPIASLAIQDRNSSRKFLFDDNLVLCGWQNEKTDEKIIANDVKTKINPFSFSGIQVIDPKIFKYFPDKEIFSLVDLYLIAARKEKIKGYLHNEDEFMDLGKIENLKKAESLF